MTNEFKRWSRNVANADLKKDISISSNTSLLNAGGWLMEIDKAAVRQQALNLMKCIETDDNLQTACTCLPEILLLLNASLDETLDLPFRGDTPCSVDLERLRTSVASNRDFRYRYYSFISLIRGWPRF
ncbi:Hypothetical protein mma_3046 [Janthinobacterium sp. Marseille]|nr:Hypothetical protein mma_3046 [Janthinobacterium sp. Marseille]